MYLETYSQVEGLWCPLGFCSWTWYDKAVKKCLVVQKAIILCGLFLAVLRERGMEQRKQNSSGPCSHTLEERWRQLQVSSFCRKLLQYLSSLWGKVSSSDNRAHERGPGRGTIMSPNLIYLILWFWQNYLSSYKSETAIIMGAINMSSRVVSS